MFDAVFDPDVEWLDHVQPVGLVVAASLLKELGLAPERQTQYETSEIAELLAPEPARRVLPEPWRLFGDVLGWPASLVVGIPGSLPVPEDLIRRLPEYDTTLAPDWAVGAAGGETGWQLLVKIEPPGIEPDQRGALEGWEATPHQRFERLLREVNVPAGVLVSDTELRLVHAPRGETSGWISFPLRPLGTVAGRPMLGGLKLLLGGFRLFNDAQDRRLPALLRRSREAQASVSSALSEQVLGALHELLRGLWAAEATLIGELAANRPSFVYEGLLTVLLRLVFLLYAEDRDLIPSRVDPAARAFYDQGYALRGLHARLLDDSARNPDTMEERLGGWGQLLALFRLLHAGDGTGWIRLRGGSLFDPDAFPFLEGRATAAEKARIPRVTDGTILRMLDGLMMLKGERLSYRTLDVEQIGSVYETVMGFSVERAAGPVLAIRAGKHNRTPVFVDLAALAARKGEDRVRFLKEEAERGQISARQQKAIKEAIGVEQAAAALEPITDERASPGKRVLPVGTPLLQPTEERRRTGSHYTPRTLTEPIVRHALEPAFERLGPDATPEQVLDLKVCDPAMGSGAFLVEACRQLAARLTQSWARWPETRPTIPHDEDEDLHARRLVAQRCLYGVDRNPLAVDLARLSLWLATLARDHEFTFLDHALKSGDSLVGLTQAQIGGLCWSDVQTGLPLYQDLLRDRVAQVLQTRAEIREAADDVTRGIQEARHRDVEGRLDDVRRLGDAIVATFFMADKDRTRERARAELEMWAGGDPATFWRHVGERAALLRDGTQPIRPLHWEIEFPEVFTGNNGGFNAVVGNPPFLGGLRVSNMLGMGMFAFLTTSIPGTGHVADLVAYFFRKSFSIIRSGGTFGLLATNSISQGDTRESGLAYICTHGGAIYYATKRLPWPGDAAVVVSVVHVVKNHPLGAKKPVLDGKYVDVITAFLFTSGGHQSPHRLKAMSSLFSQGTNIRSPGFLFGDNGEPNSLADAQSIIRSSESEAARIFPYLGGEEINTSPTQEPRRLVMNLSDIQEESELSKWPLLEAIVRRKVKPERDALGQNPNNIPLKRRWWAYHAERREFYKRISECGAVLVISRVSPHMSFVSQPVGRIWGESLNLFLFRDMADFANLQSRVHETWVRFFGSTLEDRLRYTPSDCFETFALPQKNYDNSSLIRVGGVYERQRAEAMRHLGEGLTKIYNRFHDPAETASVIQQLRDLHHDMDVAVLRAYGWNDLANRAAPEFLTEDTEPDHRYQGRLFWPAPFRDEVLARLLDLNAQRAVEERAAGFTPPSAAVDDELEDA